MDFCNRGSLKAIIGAAFLKHYALSVEMKSHRLLDPLTHLKLQGIASSGTSSLVLSLLPKQPKTDYQKILTDFPTITNPYNRERPNKTRRNSPY